MASPEQRRSESKNEQETSEEDEDVLKISDDEEDQQLEKRSYCVIAKLWTNKAYNTRALFDTMKKLWNPREGMVCGELGNRMLSFQFNSKRDRDMVMERTPWQFNKHLLVLKEVCEATAPSDLDLESTLIWAKIYDIPLKGRNQKTIKMIGKRFGEVKEIDESTLNGFTRAVRIRLSINLNEPLKKGTKIQLSNAKPCWVQIAYERLPIFCYWCGRIGHSQKECGEITDEEYEEISKNKLEMPFGEWMRASPMKQAYVVAAQREERDIRMKRTLFKKEATLEQQEGNKKQIDKVEKELQLTRITENLQKIKMGTADKEENKARERRNKTTALMSKITADKGARQTELEGDTQGAKTKKWESIIILPEPLEKKEQIHEDGKRTQEEEKVISEPGKKMTTTEDKPTTLSQNMSEAIIESTGQYTPTDTLIRLIQSEPKEREQLIQELGMAQQINSEQYNMTDKVKANKKWKRLGRMKKGTDEEGEQKSVTRKRGDMMQVDGEDEGEVKKYKPNTDLTAETAMQSRREQ